MKLFASDLYSLYQPSICELRVYLNGKGIEAAEPSAYAKVLRKLGERHELAYLKSHSKFLNLGGFPTEERLIQTKKAIQEQVPVLYHPLFRIETTLANTPCTILGEPDFLIWTPEGYIIQDVKISRRISENDHPEVLRQLELYGWLFEQSTHSAPARLEIITGTGDACELPYPGGERALATFATLVQLRKQSHSPYSPLGWTKCLGCGYRNHCWPRAEKKRDVALVADLDLGLATALHADGIETISQFLKCFTPENLETYIRPWGEGQKKVGRKATQLLLNARAWEEGREILLQKPEIPQYDHYVMFDLEGVPPQLADVQKMYLWGLQVMGKKNGPFSPALASFGPEGDREGWERFLNQAESIFAAFGSIPFVHWSAYEKTNIKLYIERFGDRAGIAERVLENCLDLLPITKAALALPLPSYSLKVVEKYIGYKRTMEEYGGDWSIAKYLEATEAETIDIREAYMQEILNYNREDLEAMWAVFQWLRSK